MAVAGLAPLATYMKIVLWLQLWVPFYVLLNLFGDMEMARTMANLSALTDGGGVSVKMWGDVGEKAQLSLGYLGSLAFTVPMFAWGLLKGGEYAMSSAVGAMTSGGGAAQTAASTGGQIAGQGNVSMGNRSFMNDNVMSSTMQGSGRQFMVNAGNVDRGNRLEKMTGLNVAEQTSVAGVASDLSQIRVAQKYGPEMLAAAADLGAGTKIQEIESKKSSTGLSTNDAVNELAKIKGTAAGEQNGAALRNQQFWMSQEHGGKYINADGTLNTDKVGALSGLWAATDALAKGALSDNQQTRMKSLQKLSEYYKVDQDFLSKMEATRKDKSLTNEQRFEKATRMLEEFNIRNQAAQQRTMDVFARITGQRVPDAMDHIYGVKDYAGANGEYKKISFNQLGKIGFDKTEDGEVTTHNHNKVVDNYGHDVNGGTAIKSLLTAGTVGVIWSSKNGHPVKLLLPT